MPKSLDTYFLITALKHNCCCRRDPNLSMPLELMRWYLWIVAPISSGGGGEARTHGWWGEQINGRAVEEKKLQCLVYLLSTWGWQPFLTNRSQRREQLCWSEIESSKVLECLGRKYSLEVSEGALKTSLYVYFCISLSNMFLVLSAGSSQEQHWELMHLRAEEWRSSVFMEMWLQCQRKGRDDVFV